MAMRPNAQEVYVQIGALGVFGVLFLIWGFSFHVPFDVRDEVVFRTFTIFGLLSITWFAVRSFRGTGRGKNRRRGISYFFDNTGSMLVVAVVGGLLGVGFLLGLNGAFRDETRPFVINGPVIRKFMSSGRSPQPVIEIRDVTRRRIYAVGVDRLRFESIEIGEIQSEMFQVGLFGWPCRP